jgi:hypothetical protein
MSQFQQEFITTVIKQYGLDLDGNQVDDVIMTWFQAYDPAWIMKAIVESLYRGRYKVKSVNNILKDWQRRGNPLYQFTPDYEREILQSLPAMLALPVTTPPPAPLERKLSVVPPPEIDSSNLKPQESEISQYHDRSTLPTNLSSSQAGETEKLATKQSENLDPVEQKVTEPRILPTSLRPSPVGSSNNSETIKIERIVPSPEKSYLFNTLRSIVEPSNRQEEEVQTSGQL